MMQLKLLGASKYTASGSQQECSSNNFNVTLTQWKGKTEREPKCQRGMEGQKDVIDTAATPWIAALNWELLAVKYHRISFH